MAADRIDELPVVIAGAEPAGLGEVRAGQLDLNSTGGWSGETLASPDGAAVPLGVADLEDVARSARPCSPPCPRTTPGRRSTLDLLGPGLTLLTGPDAHAWTTATASLDTPFPLTVHTLDRRPPPPCR